MNLTHPLFKGCIATVLVVALSLWACVAMSPDALLGWGTLIPVAMVPAQIVISLFWGCKYPQPIAALPQPWCGLAYLGLTAAVGSMVAWISWRFVGGGVTPPTPFVNMFLILVVPVSAWLVVVFQAWPFTSMTSHQGAAGVALWISAYAISLALFRSLFNFSFLKEAPFYVTELDPAGLMTAWIPLVFSIATVMVLLSLVLLDFWPVAILARRLPWLAKQPYFGLASGVLIVLVTVVVWHFFVGYGGMDLVVFLVRVCVSVVFGLFVLLVMLEGMPSLALPQPLRGLVLIGIALVLGAAVFPIYRAVALSHFDLPTGQPAYVQELWLASAMLSITFPAMVLFAGYFKFWPLARSIPVSE